MGMKVILKKSVEDWFWGGEECDMLTLKPMSKALTECYLPHFSLSPLKTFLLKRLTTFKQMYLYLKVECEDDSPVVKSISLECDLLSDWERLRDSNKVNWNKIDECMTEYFQSIGYKNIRCTNDEDIANFVERLEQDVPLAKEYFKVLYKCNEEIVRIGYFGENDEYEIYVKTDDEETTPHFHIRDAETKGERFETCVCFETNHYCLHGEYGDVLRPEQQALLKEYMESLSLYKLYALPLVRNYEWAANMWNLNNETTQVTLQYDNEDEVIIPDYDKMND